MKLIVECIRKVRKVKMLRTFFMEKVEEVYFYVTGCASHSRYVYVLVVVQGVTRLYRVL